MERPKYSQNKSIPAVELSLRPLEGGRTSGVAQKEPKALLPMHVAGESSDAIKVDANDLRVISARPARAE